MSHGVTQRHKASHSVTERLTVSHSATWRQNSVTRCHTMSHCVTRRHIMFKVCKFAIISLTISDNIKHNIIHIMQNILCYCKHVYPVIGLFYFYGVLVVILVSVCVILVFSVLGSFYWSHWINI